MNDGMLSWPRSDGGNPARPYASRAQAQDHFASRFVLSAASFRDAMLAVGHDVPGATSAANGGSTNSAGYVRTVITGSTANGTASFNFNAGGPGNQNLWAGNGTAADTIAWNKRRWIAARICRSAGGSANSVFQFALNINQLNYPGVATLYSTGIVCEIRNTRYWLVVRNSSTTTSVDSGVDYVSGASDVIVESDGLGVATLTVDGAVIAVCSGAPTAAASSAPTIRFSVSNGGDAVSTSWSFSKPFWSYA